MATGRARTISRGWGCGRGCKSVLGKQIVIFQRTTAISAIVLALAGPVLTAPAQAGQATAAPDAPPPAPHAKRPAQPAQSASPATSPSDAASQGADSNAPTSLLPPAPAASPTPGAPTPGAPPLISAPVAPGAVPGAPQVVPPQPIVEPVMPWTVADAQALLDVIDGIGAEGLIAADYNPEGLRAAIKRGQGDPLDQAASKSFAWLAEDLREGRTPVEDRVQWFALDTDRETFPTATLMAKALADHDVPGVLASLDPTVPDYAALKQALADAPPSDKAGRAMIRANMDRWRWLPRDLGDVYLLTNVPEFELRLTVKNKIIRTYKTVVGKPGLTATPQLAEKVQAVVFNPTWTVPQSIIKREGLGAKLVSNPGLAKAQGYKVTVADDGTVTVVQQPGDRNSLGRLKIDMPNPHSIYLHDTPQKALFDKPVRAFSHGCIRTERALELGMTMAILGAGLDPNDAADISRAGKYKRVAMTRIFPVYITYFTMGVDINGQLTTFGDIYGRDAPVLASFKAPREEKTEQRISAEPVIKLDNPL
jgi:murein L,D-transpeptidase YcbB/YkuD